MRKLVLLGLALLVIFSAGSVLAQDPSGGTIPITIAPGVLSSAADALDAGNVESAITQLSVFILLNPTYAPAYYLRGFAYARLNDADSALADLTQALAFPAPTADFTAEVYRIRSVIYLQQENIPSALADMDKGLEAAPESPDLLLLRGQTLSDAERYDEALVDLSKFIELNPTPSDFLTRAYFYRGVSNAAVGNLDDAATDFGKVLEMKPDDVFTYLSRADVYVQQENYDAALDDLNQAITLQDNIAELYLRRAVVQNLLGHSAEAADDYLKFVRSGNYEVNTDYELRPGESQVVEMDSNVVYLMGFVAGDGQKVTVTTSTRDGQGTDPLIIIVAADGTLLAADDDSGEDLNAQIADFALPGAGQYLVLLSHGFTSENGSVRVQLQFSN